MDFMIIMFVVAIEITTTTTTSATSDFFSQDRSYIKSSLFAPSPIPTQLRLNKLFFLVAHETQGLFPGAFNLAKYYFL